MIGTKWLSVLWLAAASAFASCQQLLLPESAKESAEGISQFIRENIRKATSAELDKLADNPDMTIALAAGWERVLRTIPEKSGDGLHAVDKKATTRFLKLVRKRVGVVIPKLWYRTVEKTMHNYDGSVWFLPGKGLDRGLDQLSLAVSRRWKLTKQNDQWKVSNGRESVLFPGSVADPQRSYASMALDKGWAYIAVPEDSLYQYKFYCTTLTDNTIKWSSHVWATGFWGNRTGSMPPPAVEIIVKDSKAIVFGSGLVPYLEVFDAKTGANVCRFCPGY